MKTDATILHGDWIEKLKSLPSESVHCCVTSPPYFSLRDYGVEGQFGLETTVKDYLAKLVEGFEEVRRVLRHDGTLWLNLGDSYNSSSSNQNGRKDKNSTINPCKYYTNGDAAAGRKQFTTGFKPKDLMMIPARSAIALQEAGWYLRSEIIWHKPNPMPESVTDRPTKSHEQIYLLTKSEKYFYDYIAIQETANYDGRKATEFKGSAKYSGVIVPGTVSNSFFSGGSERWQSNASGEMVRNKRSVWTVATAALADAHFATFPEKLIEPCILAGTSEKGACGNCGSPYKRIVEKETDWQERKQNGATAGNVGQSENYQNSVHGKNNTHHYLGTLSTKQIGWQKSCDCSSSEIIPCTVLDCFNGAGTTGLVSLKNHRNYIGIELNQDYIDLTNRRLYGLQARLF